MCKTGDKQEPLLVSIFHPVVKEESTYTATLYHLYSLTEPDQTRFYLDFMGRQKWAAGESATRRPTGETFRWFNQLDSSWFWAQRVLCWHCFSDLLVLKVPTSFCLIQDNLSVSGEPAHSKMETSEEMDPAHKHPVNDEQNEHKHPVSYSQMWCHQEVGQKTEPGTLSKFSSFICWRILLQNLSEPAMDLQSSTEGFW